MAPWYFYMTHKEIIWTSITGVTHEIKRRETIIRMMRAYINNPGTSGAQYSFRYIYSNGPRLLKEIWRLKVIRVELFYQYNLKLLFEKVN